MKTPTIRVRKMYSTLYSAAGCGKHAAPGTPEATCVGSLLHRTRRRCRCRHHRAATTAPGATPTRKEMLGERPKWSPQNGEMAPKCTPAAANPRPQTFRIFLDSNNFFSRANDARQEAPEQPCKKSKGSWMFFKVKLNITICRVCL